MKTNDDGASAEFDYSTYNGFKYIFEETVASGLKTSNAKVQIGGADVEVTVGGTTYLESIQTQLFNHVTWLGANLTREGMTFKSTFQINSNGSISDR